MTICMNLNVNLYNVFGDVMFMFQTSIYRDVWGSGNLRANTTTANSTSLELELGKCGTNTYTMQTIPGPSCRGVYL